MFLGEKRSPCERLRGIRTIPHTYNIYPILHYPPLILSRSLRSLANKQTSPIFDCATPVSVSLATLARQIIIIIIFVVVIGVVYFSVYTLCTQLSSSSKVFPSSVWMTYGGDFSSLSCDQQMSSLHDGLLTIQSDPRVHLTGSSSTNMAAQQLERVSILEL